MATYAIYQGWETDPQVTRYEIGFNGNGSGGTTVVEAPSGVTVADAAAGAGEYLITLPTPSGIGSAIEISSIQVSCLAAAGTDATAKVISYSNSARTVQVQYAEAGAGSDPSASEYLFVTITTKNSLANQ